MGGNGEEKEGDSKDLLKDNIALHQANIKAATEEIKLARLNPNNSMFFEWHPHKGLNRKQARNFRHKRNK